MGRMKPLLAIGTAAIDIKTRLDRSPLPSTDVPGRITIKAGGVTRNIAENLAHLGQAVIFSGILGNDPQARLLIEFTEQAGVEVQKITQSAPTPTDLPRLKLGDNLPTATLNVVIGPDGRQIAGAFSGDLLDALQPSDLDPLRDLIQVAPAIVCDCGLPADVLATLRAMLAPETFFYCNPGSVALAPRLESVLDRCDLLTCNHLEAAELTGVKINGPAKLISAAMILVKQGLKRAVVTFGARGLAYADETISQYHPALPAQVVDATGAGDALAAAMIASLLEQQPLAQCLKRGLAAAALTCESEDSVAPDISAAAVERRIS
jgi:pseudouridine kinase